MRFAAPLFVVVLTGLCASGCGGLKSSYGTGGGGASYLTPATAVDAQGNCTSSFVSAYNAVITQATLAQAMLNSSGPLTPAQATSKLQNLLSACQRILANQGSTVPVSVAVAVPAYNTSTTSTTPAGSLPACKAVVGQTSSTVSNQNLTSTCQTAAAIAANGTGPSGAAGTSSSTGGTPGQPPVIPPAGGSGGGSGSTSNGGGFAVNPTFQIPTTIALVPAAPPVSLVASSTSGFCTPAFATAYANLRAQLANAATQTLSTNATQSIRSSCSAFFGSLASPVSCSANLNGSIQVISSNTLLSPCAAF